MWPKPGGLVYLLYVIKSPQSSMILPADHVSRAVISARLQLLNGFPGDPLPLIKSDIGLWNFAFQKLTDSLGRSGVEPKKVKKKRLVKPSDALPANKLRTNHPSLASGTGGKTLANLEQIMPKGSHLLVREQLVAPSVVPPSQEGQRDKYVWGRRDLEILELKSKLAEKETEAAEAIRLRDQVSSLSEEKSALTAEVSVLKVTIAQKDHDISLLDSHPLLLHPTGKC
ncbi:hypothetical protein Tco_0591474 [Tanacetum coccineum]